jgi:glycosyltransferase involved in cell wall biosynthesis
MNPEVATVTTVSANVLIRNELANVDSLVQNLLDAGIDEIVFLDGGSTDGSWELLQAWREREPRIIPLRWPQPAGSEYKLGFKEVQRRNLMIEASSSSHILYIDADERISLDFKQKIPLASDCVAVSFTSFWDKRIRVNGPDDRVWMPDMKFRIFRNTRRIRFKSTDRNGLHNFLSWYGIKIPLGVTRGGAHRLFARAIRPLLGINTLIQTDGPRIFHYHYYDLSRKKVNDLRSAEFEWPVRFQESRGTERGVVYVHEATEDDEAQRMTRQYWLQQTSIEASSRG